MLNIYDIGICFSDKYSWYIMVVDKIIKEILTITVEDYGQSMS